MSKHCGGIMFYLITLLIILNIISFVFILKYRYMATHDLRTGLLLKTEFERLLVKRMLYIQKHPSHILLYYMVDLDDFKQVNDTHGHLWGDLILRKIADTLQANVRSSDLVARYGGDEFCICITTKFVGSSHGKNIGKRLIDAVKKVTDCGVSIGFSSYTADMPVNVNELKKLIKKADSCLYAAKRNGKNQTIG